MRNFLSSFLAVWALAATFAFAFRPEAPACVIGLDKMNVFYMGVDNPVSILVRGVSENDIRIETSENLSIKKESGMSYTVRASKPVDGTITISGGQLKPVTFKYRVKRIPDPAPRFGTNIITPVTIDASQFIAQEGLANVLENVDFDASCEMIGFKVIHARNGRFLAEATNTGAKYTSSVRSLIDSAQSGDSFVFEEIKVRCPDDTVPRVLGSLSFVIR